MNRYSQVSHGLKHLLLSSMVLACLLTDLVEAAVVVTNLVTDDQGANPATLTDPNLVNA